MNRHARLITAGAILSLLVAATPFAANAVGLSMPFGGTITAIRPCVGSGLFTVNILEPPPLPPITITAYPSPFLYYIMSHPAQHVLGLMTAPAFCLLNPDNGFGITAPGSFFYGTSI